MQCPKAVLSNTVVTSHMWLFTFKLIKVKREIRLFGHTSHILGAQKTVQIDNTSIIAESSSRQPCTTEGWEPWDTQASVLLLTLSN